LPFTFRSTAKRKHQKSFLVNDGHVPAYKKIRNGKQIVAFGNRLMASDGNNALRIEKEKAEINN
jgi:hypothetical protein